MVGAALGGAGAARGGERGAQEHHPVILVETPLLRSPLAVFLPIRPGLRTPSSQARVSARATPRAPRPTGRPMEEASHATRGPTFSRERDARRRVVRPGARRADSSHGLRAGI